MRGDLVKGEVKSRVRGTLNKRKNEKVRKKSIFSTRRKKEIMNRKLTS